MERRRATVAIGIAAALSLFAISIGAPRVRDAVTDDLDAVLDEPGEYQEPVGPLANPSLDFPPSSWRRRSVKSSTALRSSVRRWW